MSELLFETYSVPSVCYGIDAMFSAHQNNISSGLVVSSSYFATHFLPLVDGKLLYSDIRRAFLGGYHTADYLLKLLQLKSLHLRRFLTAERIEYLKEKACYVALDFFKELYSTPEIAFQLPFGGFVPEASKADAKSAKKEKMKGEGDRFKAYREAKQEEKRRLALHELAQANKELTKLTANGADLEGPEAMKLKKQIKVLHIRLEGRSLLDTPDDQLDDAELAEKKRQKIKADAKKAREQRSDPKFVQSLVLQRNNLLEKKRMRQKAKAERGGRKSTAAQEKLQTIASAAFEEPAAKRARKAQGKRLGETEDDDFGKDDADWDIYLKMGNERDAESEEEEMEIRKIEEQLQKLAPQELEPAGEMFVRPRTEEELAASYQLRLTNERIRAPEVLFQPSLIGQDCMGLSETLAQVYKTCPKAAYAALTERVFLTGGNVLYPRMAQRISIDLDAALPAGTKHEVMMAKDPLLGKVLEEDFSPLLDSWRGAAKWARSPGFSKSCMTKRMWAEQGPGYFQEYLASNKYVPSPPPDD